MFKRRRIMLFSGLLCIIAILLLFAQISLAASINYGQSITFFMNPNGNVDYTFQGISGITVSILVEGECHAGGNVDTRFRVDDPNAGFMFFTDGGGGGCGNVDPLAPGLDITITGTHNISIFNTDIQGTATLTLTCVNNCHLIPKTQINAAAELPPPPPAKLCYDMNFEEDGRLRADTPLDRFDVYCRMLVEDSAYSMWLGGPLTNAGNIGNTFVLDQNIIQAVDVFSPYGKTAFQGSVSICLYGDGAMISLDANQSPRVPRPLETFVIDDFPGYTCGTIQGPATLALVLYNGANSGSDIRSLEDCMVTTTDVLRLRAQPSIDSDILARVPYDTTLTSVMRTDHWVYVVYDRKPGWMHAAYLSTNGDCG